MRILATLLMVGCLLGAAPQKTTKVIKGLKPVDVYLNMEDKGFKTEKKLGGEQSEWTSRKKDGYREYSVEAFGPDASSVSMVRATLVHPVDGGAKPAADFLGYVATLPYTGSDPKKARAWVEKNIGKTRARTTIGPARFELIGGTDSHSYMLILRPI